MSDNLKPKKIDENTVAYHDKLTNDPVAIVKRIKPRYGNKSTYVASWHPVMKELYPDETSTFKHMNIGEADSASTILNSISGSYERLLDPKHAKDLLKVKYAGDMSKEWNDPETVSYSGSPVTAVWLSPGLFYKYSDTLFPLPVVLWQTQLPVCCIPPAQFSNIY